MTSLLTAAETRRVESLLPGTLENALRAPFYRRTLGAAAPGVRTVKDLSRLPLLDKVQASRAQRALCTRARPAGPGVFSSGTTRGEAWHEPLQVPLSADELRARAAVAEAAPLGDDPFPGWTLSVVSVHHGLPRRLPARDEVMVPWLHDVNALAMLEATLARPQPDGRRITAMTIGSGPLKVLTAWLQQRGVDPARFGVKLIGTFSYRLSRRWQGLIERRFGATVFDNYSLSELGTPFTTCAACGWLHLGTPPLVVELLDLVRDRPAAGRRGRLVFTTLAPYSQVMPFIRYDSGDVGEVGPPCRATGQRGLRVLGRLRHGLVVDGAFALNPVDVRDTLEDFAHVARTPHPMVTLGHVQSDDVGPPRWTVWRRGRAVGVTVETRFDPSVYPDDATALREGIARGLAERDAVSRRLLGQGRLRVELSGRVRALVERYD